MWVNYRIPSKLWSPWKNFSSSWHYILLVDGGIKKSQAKEHFQTFIVILINHFFRGFTSNAKNVSTFISSSRKSQASNTRSSSISGKACIASHIFYRNRVQILIFFSLICQWWNYSYPFANSMNHTLSFAPCSLGSSWDGWIMDFPTGVWSTD